MCLSALFMICFPLLQYVMSNTSICLSWELKEHTVEIILCFSDTAVAVNFLKTSIFSAVLFLFEIKSLLQQIVFSWNRSLHSIILMFFLFHTSSEIASLTKQDCIDISNAIRRPCSFTSSSFVLYWKGKKIVSRISIHFRPTRRHASVSMETRMTWFIVHNSLFSGQTIVQVKKCTVLIL